MQIKTVQFPATAGTNATVSIDFERIMQTKTAQFPATAGTNATVSIDFHVRLRHRV